MEGLTFDNIDPRKRNIIMIGLAIALFAACFDGTVTTTCGPIIASGFNASELLPWLTTGYLLLETVAIPLAGKLSDLYGRKRLLLIGLAFFGLASLLAGIAWDMWVVILARSVQGLGGGILIPVATAAVSDLYAPDDRGKIQGILGALFGIGMGFGPLIGGSFASVSEILGLAGWHWAFLINLPIVIAVFIMCRGQFPSSSDDAKPSVDYKGIAMICVALVSVIIYFQLLSKGSIKMVSWTSLLCILVIIVLFRIFIEIEKSADEPIIAPYIFVNPTVRSAAIMLFLLGFAMVGDELFMGLYLQKVTGHSPIDAGMYILVMVGGMIVSSLAGGALLNRTGVKPWVIAGPILMATGFFMFSHIETSFNATVFCLSELLFGLGGGCLLASLMTAVQNSCEHSEVGMTTSAVNLMRNIGSTVGTSIFTLVVNAAIYKESLTVIGGDIGRELGELGIGILDRLDDPGMAPLYDSIRSVFTDAVAAAFGFGALVLLIAVIIGFMFKVVTTAQTKDISEYARMITESNGKV